MSQYILHMLARLVRPARTRLARLPAARWCSAAEQLETFHRAADSTLQGIQEVIEDYADETPTQEIDVEFLTRLRGQQVFDSEAAFIEQMQADIRAARASGEAPEVS